MQQYYNPHHHRPSRHDKKKSQVRKAIVVLTGLVIVAGIIGYFYITMQASIRPTDPNTFCPTDAKGPNSVTAILIDRTDSFNPTQQAAIRDRLNDVLDHTTKYDLIEIYSVEPTKSSLLKPEFFMCNPGRGDDVSNWTGNQHLVEQRWKTSFDAPMQNLFTEALSAKEADVSPIMESIQSIAVTDVGAQKFKSKSVPRRLIVVSDLIQYVEGYSQYKPITPFNQFRKTPYYQNVRTDLSDISIELWYIRRERTLHLQGEKHVDFWRDYIADQGGSVDKVWYVPGT
jgi:hypothetical protein